MGEWLPIGNFIFTAIILHVMDRSGTGYHIDSSCQGVFYRSGGVLHE